MVTSAATNRARASDTADAPALSPTVLMEVPVHGVNANHSGPALAMADYCKQGGLDVPYEAFPSNAVDRATLRATFTGVLGQGPYAGEDNLMVQFISSEITAEANQ